MTGNVTSWDAIGILKSPTTSDRQSALIVLNQPISNTKLFREVYRLCPLRVAADGGANRLYQLAQHSKNNGKSIFDTLEHIIGDLDSAKPVTLDYYRSHYTQIHKDPDEYSTDFGKAMKFIRSLPSSTTRDIIAFGGCGGRVDQGISQLHHLYIFHEDSSRLFLMDNDSFTFLLKPGKHVIRIKDGGEEIFAKYVGILPLDGPARITTKGLEWDVTDWETRFSGNMSTSNHILPGTTHVEVETDNGVLFTVALKSTE